MKYAAVIVAAGSGSRMHLGYNKVFYMLDEKDRVIDRSIRLFQMDEDCEEIVVVLSHDELDITLPEGIMKEEGGKTRAESVYHGVQKVHAPYVMIHDGARPFLKQETVDLLKEKLQEVDACFPGIREKDTLKEVRDGKVRTVDREYIYHAQTPQAFKTALIVDCLKKVMENNDSVTDDIQAVELYGNTEVAVVEGDENNYKLTVRYDLERMK